MPGKWQSMAYRGRADGFTLVELLVVVAVVATLLTVAIPSYRTVVLNSSRAAAVNDLVAALTLARTEAQKQRRQVVVCPLLDGRCTPGRGNWNNGWLVYVDLAGTAVPDPANPILAVFERRNGRISISGSAAQLAFRPSPRRGINGTVTFCDARGAAQARSVVVAPSGRVRASRQVSRCA